MPNCSTSFLGVLIGIIGYAIVVTYVQFDSNIRVLYIFLGFLKNTWYKGQFSSLCIIIMLFKKYLRILLFEHLRKILVFRMSLLWAMVADLVISYLGYFWDLIWHFPVLSYVLYVPLCQWMCSLGHILPNTSASRFSLLAWF